MNVFVVQFDHKYGTEIWVAKTEALANEIVRSVKTRIFREHDEDDHWPLEKALSNWTEYTGGGECFSVNEVPLIEDIQRAREAQA